MNQLIKQFEKRVFQSSKTHPAFRPGDTVRVHYKIEESGKGGEKKFRIQHFEGVCIRKKKGSEAESSFTVRKMGANNVGVERVFAFHSPLVEKIDLVSAGVVRRSRLYYLRNLVGKAARIRSRRLPEGFVTSTVDANEAPKPKKEKKASKKKKAKKS